MDATGYVNRQVVHFDVDSIDFHLNQWELPPWDRASIDDQCLSRSSLGDYCTKIHRHGGDHVAHLSDVGFEIDRWRDDAE